MYNYFLPEPEAETPLVHKQSTEAVAAPDAPASPTPTDTAGAIAAIGRSLSGRFGKLQFDMDTVLLFALIWFLLTGGDGDGDGQPDPELLLLIGALFLLGL